MTAQYTHELDKALGNLLLFLASLELTRVGQTAAFMAAEDLVAAFRKQMERAIKEGAR